MAENWATSESGHDLHLELTGTGGLRAGLMDALRDAIRVGRLRSGIRLPSSRALAADLGIARNTVADAYAELTAEGWLTARQGSGTRVAARAAVSGAAAGRPPRPGAPRLTHDLRPGRPDAAGFPRADWIAATRRALHAAPAEAFGPGDPAGRIELRRALAGYLARARGVHSDPDRIVVCSGAAQALQLLAAVRPGTFAVESRGLPHHRRLLARAGIRTVPLPVDAGGADPAGLSGSAADAVLLTPAHQFPTGGALLPERRAAVIDWARAGGGLVLEDDYDGEFRYDRQPVGALQGLDPGRVAYLGSASKSLSPGLRLGWMVLPPPLVPEVLAAKGSWEPTVSMLDQLVFAELLESGGYDRQIRRMRRGYRARRDQLTAALGARLPQLEVTGIAAGLHAVLELPPGTEELVLREGERAGLGLTGLGWFRHPEATCPERDGVVVGYGTPPDHGFTGAVTALCETVARGLSGPRDPERPERPEQRKNQVAQVNQVTQT
jgi:GntR family transcriptional regulator/MocR family aminotransferase